MIRVMIGDRACSVSQLPWNENAALAADFHAGKALVKAVNRGAHTLRKGHRLRVAHLGLAVVTHHDLTVFVSQRHPVVIGGVELDPISGPVAGVKNLVQLVGFGHGALADLNLLVAQGDREERFRNS